MIRASIRKTVPLWAVAVWAVTFGVGLSLGVPFAVASTTGLGFADRSLEAGSDPATSADTAAPDFLPAVDADGAAFPGAERPRLGLLDSRRFSFSHSVSYGFSSGSYGNTSAGLWNTGITYRVSDPLTLRADVAAWLDTSGEGSVLAPDHVFLRNLSLDYRLGESTRIQFSYRSAPAGTWGFAHEPFAIPGRVTP